jgi:Caspase domain/Schlafen, AlbA_2
MSIRKAVEKLFYDNTNYTTPDQATNQASSLDALSTDLYTDSKRFIYELLQNADDSPEEGLPVKVWIKAFGDILVVAHSGKAFDERDVQGLCSVNNGTKKADASKTGYKGIGFKSVFGQSKQVTVYTNNEYFRFDSSFPFVWQWDECKAEWERNSEREFVDPWQIIPIYTEYKDISEPIHQYLQAVEATVATIIELDNVIDTFLALQELSGNVNMFLFLKNISEIKFELNENYHIEIDRLESNNIELKRNGKVEARWLIYTTILGIPAQLSSALEDERNIPDKLTRANNIELTLAAKIDESGIAELTTSERLLYSYLPTDETKYQFPVLVNTSFLTNANREHLHTDSKWNQWLFKNIAIEIFQWISILVVGQLKLQAYRLIPQDIRDDELGKHFNSGIREAIKTVKFVITKENQLVRVEDSIVDFTYLSEKIFVGEEEIRNFVSDLDSTGVSCTKAFVKYSGYGNAIKSLGADCFEWKDLPRLLKTPSFSRNHSVDKNMALIRHLKYLSEKDSVVGVTSEALSKWPFIIDHKNRLNIPSEIYFPTADDNSWDEPESELAFLHLRIQEWLSVNPDIRAWVEQLGVVEKTDISFINKTLIPNSKNYITEENAIQTIRDLFNIYKKGDLKSELLAKLSNLKIITNKGKLVAAKDCILSNDYSPRLEIEEVLELDVFVSAAYMDDGAERDEWKRFFKFLKVADGINFEVYNGKVDKSSLISYGFNKEYFEEEDKKFTPAFSTFTTDSYREFYYLSYIHYTIENYSFAKPFWKDVIENISPVELSKPTTAFWGYSGRAGRETGNEVGNYVSWVINNLKAIPMLTKECNTSSNVLLNTEEIKSLSGGYLPVFDGVDLSADWKSFFKFRTEIQLGDYLELLSKISTDVTEKQEVKRSNTNRIQIIYTKLMDLCVNWGQSELKVVSDWADSALLLNTQKEFTSSKSTKYFLDGNDGIFQGQFNFLELSSENRQHSNIVEFLKAFKVTILEQSDFELKVEKVDACTALVARLEVILPFFKAWIESEDGDDKTQETLAQLGTKVTKLDIYEAETLQITYEEISFTKNVNVHLDSDKLYVTTPWNSNKVLFQLSGMLCRYFNLSGHDKKLNFLICSTAGEIEEYFEQESIDMPTGVTLESDEDAGELKNVKTLPSTTTVKSFDEIKSAISNGTSPDFFHIPTSEYERFLLVEKLISRAVANVINYLNNLSDYDCENHFEIAPSIIGGITKNGQELTIVARPSDNDAVLLYYTSEFDVLEYVDAEFWCEDGESVPQKITMGHLLKMTKINRIPITKFTFEEQEFKQFIKKQKSNDFEFDAVPSSPYRIAQIISSFANTEGGALVYGIRKSGTENQFIGLSADFRMDEITKKALMMISPLPTIAYSWVNVGGKYLFIINVEESDEDMLIGSQKYIREDSQTIIEEDIFADVIEPLAISNFETTVAIIIGIENYKSRENNQVPPVLHAEDDALLFKERLVEQFKVEEDDIHMFINEDALKSDLENGLGWLFHSLSEKDRLVFYYVGHGFYDGTTNYLSTYDTHINNVADTAVSLRKILLDPLLKSKCKSGLVFIDACAQSFKNEKERALITDLNSEDFQLFKSEHPHFATFLSCQPGQSSYSCHELGHGIWTYYLDRALSGEEADALKSNKYITDRTLNDYLAKSVSAYANNMHGFEQNPKAILDSNCENVIVKI